MCGIFGYINWNPKEKIEEEKLISAANLLFHRGPDGGAYYSEPPVFLAHRRLSIIDIQGGEQPMFSHNGRYGIVFNGEIYNYIELREELQKLGHIFYSKSDTEVILNGYAQWGAEVCKKLIGMFSFALYDNQKRTLFLARDRLGEKPLFYFFKNKIVSFASEIKALSYIAPFALEIDSCSLTQYLCLNYVPGTSTLIKDIYKVNPGNWMLISETGIKKEQYWSSTSHNEIPTSFNDSIDRLEILLDQSVKIGCRSDVPITLALSGGIDSSLVGYYAASQGSLTEAYCVDFQEKGFSEYPQAKIVADKLGLKLNSVPFSSDSMEEFLKIVYYADDPLADSSSLAVWALSKAVSQKYKVMLGGDGGDEIFGGYLTYKATLMYQNLFKYLPTSFRLMIKSFSHLIPNSDGKVSFGYKLMRFLRAFDLSVEDAHFTWNGTWHPEDVKKILAYSANDFSIFKSLEGATFKENDMLRKLQMMDLENYLPSDILTKVDRITMAYGLESRAPLLHPNLVEFGLALPKSYKISQNGQLKFILRKLAEKKFGKSISQAKKQGFSIPVNQWLRKEAKDLLLDCLSPQSLSSITFLNKEFIERAIKDHLDGKKQLGFELWGLMVLVSWYQQKIEKPYYPTRQIKLNRVNPISKDRCING